MHLHAPGIVIDPRYVRELSQVKVRVKFAIDAPEQVEIKSGRHSECIIVSCEQLSAGLLQVRPQQQ